MARMSKDKMEMFKLATGSMRTLNIYRKMFEAIHPIPLLGGYETSYLRINQVRYLKGKPRPDRTARRCICGLLAAVDIHLFRVSGEMVRVLGVLDLQ